MNPMSPARIRIYHWIPQVLKTVFICSEMDGDSVRCWAARRSCFVTISANHSFRVQSRGCVQPCKPTCPVGAISKLWFRGARMSGRLCPVRSHGLSNSARRGLGGWLCLASIAAPARAQERREREPNSVYAERRVKLAAQTDGPIVLWGFTGREEVSQAYVFAQEENFYYLTGHNEEGAGLILLPPAQGNHAAPADASLNGQRGILFLPP